MSLRFSSVVPGTMDAPAVSRRRSVGSSPLRIETILFPLGRRLATARGTLHQDDDDDDILLVSAVFFSCVPSLSSFSKRRISILCLRRTTESRLREHRMGERWAMSGNDTMLGTVRPFAEQAGTAAETGAAR